MTAELDQEGTTSEQGGSLQRGGPPARQVFAVLALAVVGCAKSPVSIDNENQSLRHRRLAFSITLPAELQDEGWELRPDRGTLNRDRRYDIDILSPDGLVARTDLSIEAVDLDHDPTYRDGVATDAWVEQYAAQFRTEYDSLERLALLPVNVGGGAGHELSFVARMSTTRDVYVYAARIQGPRTSLEFWAFLPNSGVADTARTAEERRQLDELVRLPRTPIRVNCADRGDVVTEGGARDCLKTRRSRNRMCSPSAGTGLLGLRPDSRVRYRSGPPLAIGHITSGESCIPDREEPGAPRRRRPRSTWPPGRRGRSSPASSVPTGAPGPLSVFLPCVS